MVEAARLRLSALKAEEYSSDADLLAACRRGEIRAFESLYRTHASRLKSIAWHLLGNPEDAEDAVHEAFLKVYRGVKGFEGHSAIGTWMCRVLINTCYDVARKRKREPEAVQTEPAEASRAPLKAALESALGRIHPSHRMVFLLFEVEGLKHSEIASILEVPEGTSKAWLYEAKRALKGLLAETRQ